MSLKPLPRITSLRWKHPFLATQMDYMPSAMTGVVLTLLSTPSPAELVNLFKRSPKVGLNFGKIFDFEEGDSGESQERHEVSASSPPPSPSPRKEREKGIRTGTTSRRRIRLLRRVRVRRTQESGQLLQRHLHRRGFADLRCVLPSVRRVVNPRL